MVFTRRFVAGIFLTTSLSLAALPAYAAVFYPRTFTLANGLQVVVVQNRLSPAVNQMVWYRAGSADEPAGQSGVAHYLEHLMFRGTRDIPPGMFSRLIAGQGGTDNAFTSYDFTAYHETVAADRLGMVMQLEADRMTNLHLTPEVAAPELKVILEERQERTDNKPQGLFHERVKATLFGNHPYGIPIIGKKAELQQMTLDRVVHFYRQHYAPNNAIVVISGNVEVSEVMRLAAGTFGRVPKREVPVRRALGKPEKPVQDQVVMKDARVQQPYVEIRTVVPSYHLANGNEAYALELLNEILDSGEVGILYRDLVIRQKVASGVSISYDPEARGPSQFVIAAVPFPGKNVDDVEKALWVSLRRLARQGVDAATVAAAKGRLKREAVFARDSLMAPGQVFGHALASGLTVEDVEQWPDRVNSVSDGDVNRALRHLVRSPYRVTGKLLPETDSSGVMLEGGHD